MFTVISESENSNLKGKLEIPTLKDFYQEAPLHEKLDDFPVSKIYDNLDYDMVILKPTGDDFLILYANPTLWGKIDKNLPKYMKDKYLSEVFPKFEELNTLKKFHYAYDNQPQNDVIFKIYEDNNIFFAGQQFCIKQKDLLYIFTKNETEYYINQENEDAIFDDSVFPKLQVSRKGEIVKVNESFIKSSGYNLKELDQIGLDNVITFFKSTEDNMNNFTTTFTFMFRNNLPVVDAEIEILTKNKTSKWFTSHIRLVKNNLINVIFNEITDYKNYKKVFFNLMEYFKDLGHSDKVIFVLYDGKNYQWTSNIFNLLEIPENENLLLDSSNILKKYILPEDIDKFNMIFDSLSAENPNMDVNYRIKTAKGNIKYLTTSLRFLNEYDGYFGFTNDRTTEHDAEEEALELQKNFNSISSNANIAVVQFKEGKYYYTPEIFNILEITPDNLVTETDIIKPYVIDEDDDNWVKFIDSLTPENPRLRKITTLLINSDKIKIIENVVEAEFDENNKMTNYIVFVRDITEEELTKQKALDLQENLDAVEEFSKIVFVTYQNGEYSWTDELFEILEIDYPNRVYDTKSNYIYNYTTPENINKIEQALKHLNLDNSVTIRYEVKTAKGNTKFLKSYLKLKKDNDKILRLGFTQDITEETLAIKEALDLKESIEGIQEVSKIVIGVFQDGKYNFTSEIYNILGVSPEEYTNTDLLSFVLPEDQEMISDSINNVTPEKPTFDYIFRFKTPSEGIKYMKTFNKATFKENGELLKIIGFQQDVTEQILAQNQALHLEENFSIIEGTSKIFIAEYENGKYSFTKEVYNILGVSPDEFSDNVNVIEQFIIPEDKHIWPGVINLDSSKSEFTLTYRIKNRSGEIIYITSYNKSLFDDNGNLIRLVAILQDVTEEEIAKKKSSRLEENFEFIQSTSRIFISEYENGEYAYTDEIYNILEINPKDYPKNISLIEKFVVPEDKSKWESFKYLTPENSEFTIKYRVKSTNGEVKHFLNHTKGLFNKNGELIRAIALIQDITDEEEAKIEAVNLKDNFELIQQSNQVFLAEYKNGKYTFTKELYTRLGIKPEDYPDTVDIVPEHLVPEDKEDWAYAMTLTPENPYTQVTYRLKTVNGEIIYIYCTNRAQFDKDGKLIKIIGLLQDVTSETLALQSAAELGENIETIEKTSKIVISTAQNGFFTFSSEIYNILEIEPGIYPEGTDLIYEYATPESRNRFTKIFENVTPENSSMKSLTTIITPTGKEKVLEYYCKAKFNEKRELTKFVSFVHDITEMVEREKELEQLSEDRKILLQEVHHRVKNNLQLILSFLNLESRFNQNDPEYVLEQTQNRIRTMALTHEEVYQSNSVSNINLEHFLTTGMNNLFNLYTEGKIKLNFNIESIELDMEKSIPLGLLVNEVALNTIKYAFPDKNEGNFYIDLKSTDDMIDLKIWDDGVGLPENVNLYNSDSLGFIIINNLTQQLEAELTVLDDVSGFGINLKFKT